MLHEVCIIGHDGDPNGQVDAAIGTLCRDLSSPAIYRKSTGWGTLTGWIAITAQPEAISVVSAQAPTADDTGKAYVNEAAGDTVLNFTLPESAPTGTEFELYGLWQLVPQGTDSVMQMDGWTLNNTTSPGATIAHTSYVKIKRMKTHSEVYWFVLHANCQLVFGA